MEKYVRVGRVLAAIVLAATVFAAVPSSSLGTSIPSSAQLPDLVNMIPIHLHVQEQQKVDRLMFTLGIANVGTGPLELVPEALGDRSAYVDATQKIYDAAQASDGVVVAENSLSGVFVFHPEHNHWHLAGVNGLSVHRARDDGSGGLWNPAPFGAAVKESFCLIDYVPLDDKGLGQDEIQREYFDCFGTHGISFGWIDYYHHSTHGQYIDITGARPGTYYFVVHANPDKIFAESNYDNNRAWVSFELSSKGNNNAVVKVLTDSYHAAGEGILPPFKTNR